MGNSSNFKFFLCNKIYNARMNTVSVQCHNIFDIAYLAPALRGHVTSSIT